MKKFLVLALMLTIGVTGTTFAQKIKIEKGDFKFLEGQKTLNVEFVYDDMTLLKEKLTNEEYIKKRAAELNEKEAGKGDEWTEKWNESREKLWEPKFMKLMNDYLSRKNVKAKQGLEKAKYTVIVETVWIYPGWFGGVMRQPAKVTTLLKVVATANPRKVLLQISSKDAPGDTYGGFGSVTNESRIAEGYAKTSAVFSKMLLKKAFKKNK